MPDLGSLTVIVVTHDPFPEALTSGFSYMSLDTLKKKISWNFFFQDNKSGVPDLEDPRKGRGR
jgi:hypothetical protein